MAPETGNSGVPPINPFGVEVLAKGLVVASVVRPLNLLPEFAASLALQFVRGIRLPKPSPPFLFPVDLTEASCLRSFAGVNGLRPREAAGEARN